MNPTPSNRPATLPRVARSLLLAALTGATGAQEMPFTQPGTGQPPPPPPAPATATPSPPAAPPPTAPPGTNFVERLLHTRLPDAIAKGQFRLNTRLRYEWATQEGVAAVTDDSHAATVRTRFGFTTAPQWGLQAQIEAENVAVLGPEGNYNAAGSNGRNYKPAVADPPTTELNQAWLSYAWSNRVTLRGGRQRLALDNHRFIGDVGWRQNQQTFDAVTLETAPISKLRLFYGYVWDVHRVFGDVPDLPAASPNHDFRSSSHLLHVSYGLLPCLQVAGYAHFLDLDLDNGTAAERDGSCATYGTFVAGWTPVSAAVSLGYRAELAWQTDHADSTLDYEALYYNLELSATVKPFAFGVGYEVLGSGNNRAAAGGRASFRTPLATLHAFNGWADVFLTTPRDGLRDLYAFAQVTLPLQVPLRFVYHRFDADRGGDYFGQEFDVVASRRFGRHWSALVKYAGFLGEDSAPPALAAPNVDLHRFWAQIEFNF